MRLVCAGLVLLTGCGVFDPCAGPEYLSFSVVHRGTLPDGSPTYSSQAPRWGASETLKPTDGVEIIFEHDTLSPNVLELYAQDGSRVRFAGDDQFVPTNGEGARTTSGATRSMRCRREPTRWCTGARTAPAIRSTAPAIVRGPCSTATMRSR